MRLAPRRLATAPARRNDLEPRLRWAGFRATLDPKTLIDDGDSRWELFAYARSGGLRRRRAVFAVDVPQAADVRAGKALVRAAVTASGRATVTVAERWVCIERHRRIGNGIVELAGTARLDPSATEPELELVRASDGAKVRFPLAVAGWTFRVQVMLSELRLAAGTVDGDAVWDMAVIAGLHQPLLSLAEQLSGAVWRAGGRDLALERTAAGGGRLLESELTQPRDGAASDGALAFPAWPATTSPSLS
jgi:hypothetical protein